MTLGCLDARLVGVLGGGHFWGKAFSVLGSMFPVPGIALRMIYSSVENPSGTFSAKALRLMSLEVSVLVNE